MLPIKVTYRAAAQIRDAGSWWFANRLAVPEALEEELQRAFDLIAQQPAIGARATNIRLTGIRRIHLSRIHYYLYYRVRSTHIEVVGILAYKPREISAPVKFVASACSRQSALLRTELYTPLPGRL